MTFGTEYMQYLFMVVRIRVRYDNFVEWKKSINKCARNFFDFIYLQYLVGNTITAVLHYAVLSSLMLLPLIINSPGEKIFKSDSDVT
jgi:hypothetical protein